MSKVICDVCGTTYAETASVCPICGCAKNTTAQTVADSAQQNETVSSYTYVKGGRFSKKNVRKRNQGSRDVPRKESQRSSDHDSDPDKANKALVAVVLLLLLAIVAVLIYIGVTYFTPGPAPSGTEKPSQTQGTLPTGDSGPAQPPVVGCTGIVLDRPSIELDAAGSVYLLSPQLQPVDTTDKVSFASSDERVATVSQTGNIMAVGGGEAVITVTCGTAVAEFKVICTFGDPAVPPETTLPPAQIPTGFVLKLNREDFTISAEGATWNLFRETDGVKASDITWTVDDPGVATVEDGKVTGVDYGDTKIHATLGDQTVSCIVRVRFHAGEGGQTGAKYTLSDKDGDATIEVGETFMLTLTDSQGAKIQVEWVASEEGFVEIDGSRITGLACGENDTVKRITVSATYEDETYTCIVRIRPKTAEE